MLVLPLSRMTDVATLVSENQTADGGLRRDFRRLTRLYCMNGGYHLQILPDGTVQGQREDGDDHIVLKLTAMDIGVVIIQGTEAGHYLAMNGEGRLYGSPTVTDECYFLEKLEENHYNTLSISEISGGELVCSSEKERQTQTGSKDSHWTEGHLLSAPTAERVKTLKPQPTRM
ncbi:putative fibroblast growth factor 1 [Xyrichtys novacula]|uniref:Fibroblast growth factor n=1 Tax=Xyrichtys novacula TaxID=13765 RepID=A0AAV1FB95_XYRNO|nr:putative fibroblast growth factor 1 [Xyrichtys novacula]